MNPFSPSSITIVIVVVVIVVVVVVVGIRVNNIYQSPSLQDEKDLTLTPNHDHIDNSVTPNPVYGFPSPTIPVHDNSLSVSVNATGSPCIRVFDNTLYETKDFPTQSGNAPIYENGTDNGNGSVPIYSEVEVKEKDAIPLSPNSAYESGSFGRSLEDINNPLYIQEESKPSASTQQETSFYSLPRPT